MQFSVRLGVTDYTGTTGTTGILLQGVQVLTDLDAFVSVFEQTIGGLTDGRISEAACKARFSPTTAQSVRGAASVHSSLLLICTNGEQYASFRVPAPSPLPLLQTGPYRGFKVDKGASGGVAGIEALISQLALYQNIAGYDYPALSWEAVLIDGVS